MPALGLECGPMSVESRSALAGQTVGAYQLVSPLGAGGMGTVWLAERSDGRFEGRAAVKFLNVALVHRAGKERFEREGNMLGRLTHPHIAHLLDAGVSATGQPYLILEHVAGEPIDQYCDHHRLSVEERIRLFLDVLASVAHAHANLIVHRDIKASNVLVDINGQVKLLDFGIAKLLEEEGQIGTATGLTREGGSALTPECAAPEQVTGGAVTTATDVYALGALLYALLSGHHPTGGGLRSQADLVRAIVEAEPLPLSEVVGRTGTNPEVLTANAARRASSPDKLRRALQGDLDTIVAKALKKNPAERYVSVTALAEDLRRYLAQEPITARPDSIAYRAAKFVRRNRTAVALATLALAASGAGVVGTLIQTRTARTQRDFALRQLSRAEAINDLNNFVLSDAAPSGKPFTVNELLARAEHIVEQQRGDYDVSRVELLISIGIQYLTQDEDGGGRRVLAKAYDFSRRLSERSTRARASCALASALAPGGDIPRAEALIEEGLGELPHQPQFVLDRVSCLLHGSEVAREAGQAERAIARVQAAQRLLKQSPLQSELLEVRALIDLAESYRVSGRGREAAAAFEQASARLTALGRDQTERAGTLFNNWGLALGELGRPLEAEQLLKQAIDISRADNAEEGVSPTLLVNYARALKDLGRLDEAADYAEHGYAKAKQSSHETAIDQSLLMRASIYRGRGDLTKAALTLDEVEPRLRRNLPAGHIAFGSLRSEQSLLAQARGDPRTALDLANQAMAMAEASVKAGHEGAVFLPQLLLRRSDLELLVDHSDEAVADATRALKLLLPVAQTETFSSSIGQAYLTLGRALDAQGHRYEAGAAYRSAAEHLENAAGPEHPDTRSARQLAAVGVVTSPAR